MSHVYSYISGIYNHNISEKQAFHLINPYFVVDCAYTSIAVGTVNVIYVLLSICSYKAIIIIIIMSI